MKGVIFATLCASLLGPQLPIVFAQSGPLDPAHYSGHPIAGSMGYKAHDTSEFSVTPKAPGIRFSQWKRGTGLNEASGDDGYVATGFLNEIVSLSAAIASGKYFYCSVIIQPNNTLTIDEITWKARRSNNGPKVAQWQYATASNDFIFQNISGELDLSSSTNLQTISFSPATPLVFPGGSEGDSIVLRVVAWNAAGGQGTLRICNGTSFNATALPLTLLSFTTQAQQQKALLQWATARENNVTGFAIERSKDGRYFELLGFVPAKNETLNDYHFEAPLLSGMHCFRLKMEELDGSFTYSPVRIVQAKTDPALLVLYPNPAKEKIHVTGIPNGASWSICNPMGNQLLVATAQEETLTIPLHSLPEGCYFFKVTTALETRSFAFLKQ